MFKLVSTAYEASAGKILKDAESQTHHLADRGELVSFLRKFQDAEVVDEDVLARVMIQGNKMDIEVRLDSGQLYLYDRNDPNRQGIPVMPEDIIPDQNDGDQGEREEGREELKVSRKNATARNLKLLGVAVLITLVIQVVFFLNSGENLLGEIKVTALPQEEAKQWIQDLSGFFIGGSAENKFGIILESDGSYTFYENFAGSKWDRVEEGGFQVVKEGNQLGVQLGDTDLLMINSRESLDYYGFELKRNHLPEALAEEENL